MVEAYFTNEPQRLGSIMASNKLTPKQFDDAVDDLRSIGSMRGFLSNIIAQGNIAMEELGSLEQAYNEQFDTESE